MWSATSPVGFAVHADRGVGVRRFDQAEHLAGLLVDPVLEVVDPVLVLGPDIGGVGLGDVLGGGPLGQVLMHVHEQRPRVPPLWLFQHAPWPAMRKSQMHLEVPAEASRRPPDGDMAALWSLSGRLDHSRLPDAELSGCRMGATIAVRLP